MARRGWKKFRDSPFMIERRIQKRKARVRWRRRRVARDSSPNCADIEMQPLAAEDRGESPILRGVGPNLRDEVRALRDAHRGLDDRMLTMFDKTLALLRNQQEELHNLGVKL